MSSSNSPSPNTRRFFDHGPNALHHHCQRWKHQPDHSFEDASIKV